MPSAEWTKNWCAREDVTNVNCPLHTIQTFAKFTWTLHSNPCICHHGPHSKLTPDEHNHVACASLTRAYIGRRTTAHELVQKGPHVAGCQTRRGIRNVLQQRRAPRQRNSPRQQRLHPLKDVPLSTLSTCCACIPGITLATLCIPSVSTRQNWAPFVGALSDAGVRSLGSIDDMQGDLTDGLQARVHGAQWVPRCSPGSRGRYTTRRRAADAPAAHGRAIDG